MEIEKGIFQRTQLLLGEDTVDRIAHQRVIIFGVGGVGSWCAESLIRSGIIHLTLVDSDHVCISNINRQLMATTKTIGKAKVEVLKERLLEINPEAEITALKKVYCAETAHEFHIDTFDYVIDAIDSLQEKCHLILHATNLSVRIFSSMGAALKMDPTRIRVDEFWKVKGCPLAKAIRNRFKREKTFPKRKFKCVYSEELLRNMAVGSNETDSNDTEIPETASEWHARKVQTNGTVSHITAIFGFTLAGLVIQDIWKRCEES